MPISSERWKTITESQFPWEREALAFVRERLPDHEPYRAWSNFEFIAESGAIYEVDLLVLSPKGFYLVEIKSQPGELSGDVHSWTWTFPDGGRQTVDNPVILANRKAKALRGLLERQRAIRGGKERVPFIEAVVFCSAACLVCRLAPAARKGVTFRDDDARDPAERTARPGIVAGLTRWTPGGADDPGTRRVDRPAAKAISRAMEEAGIRPTQRYRRVGDYELGELLADTNTYQDWAATHRSIEGVSRRVRLYPLALGSTDERRASLRRAAEREFRILEGVRHEGILRAVDCPVHERGPALIFEHEPRSVRLDHFLRDRGDRLSVDARMSIVRQIAEAVRYAHEKRLVHRALSPQSVLVLDPGGTTPRTRVFNWQAGLRAPGSSTSVPGISGTTHPEQLVEDTSLVYMAPEVVSGAPSVEADADVFSLGAIAYHVFSGQAPATSLFELQEKLRGEKGLRISAVLDGTAESLERLILDSTHPEVSSRLGSVDEFLDGLESFEDEFTRPDVAETFVADPTEATVNDRLEGGFVVKKRLGKGSSAVALLVERDGKESVLKVALDPVQNERLRNEAEVLRKLHHQHIVALEEEVQIGERAGLLMARAGEETLAQRIRSEGRLHADHLQRFGEELLLAVNWLEEQGIPHRDIKPDNIGVDTVGKSKAPHLVLFDFSLARTPADNIRAGTHPYLDPFLSFRNRRRWDLDAERFSAAVTLYEMATGTLPRWGDGQSDPAVIDDEVSIDSDLFESGLREPLTGFFARALARDHAARFDNCEEMLREWRHLFEAGESRPATTERPPTRDLNAALAGVTRETQVALLPLGTRAQNALDRLNAVTVGDLLDIPLFRVWGMRGVGHKTRREIVDIVAALSQRLGAAAVEQPKQARPKPSDDERPTTGLEAASVDLLVARLLPSTRGRVAESQHRVLRLLLGLDELANPPSTPWPSQTEVASEIGITRARVSQIAGTARQRWAKSAAFTHLRGDLVGLLDASGGVMTAAELATAVVTLRGSARAEPVRSRQALAVTRAAVETERELAEPRFLMRRAGPHIFVARTQELADYAERLGHAADELAAGDPLPAPLRVLEALRAVTAPEGASLPDARLVHLSAAASAHAAVSSRLELYPRRMEPSRALKLAYGALLGARELTVDEVRQRVAGRYPEAEELPGRPTLDGLVAESGLGYEWDPSGGGGQGAYTIPFRPGSVSIGSSSLSRYPTAHTGLPPQGEVTPEMADARRFEERLRYATKGGAFLALTVRPRDVGLAERTLLNRFPLARLSFDELLLQAMHDQAAKAKVDWDVVLGADATERSSRDWQNLMMLVRRAIPVVEKRLLEGDRTVLLLHPGLLARYDQLDVLERLRSSLGRDGAAPGLWLLIPSDDRVAMPVLDGHAVPVISSGQWARIPDAWLRNVHRAAPPPPTAQPSQHRSAP